MTLRLFRDGSDCLRPECFAPQVSGRRRRLISAVASIVGHGLTDGVGAPLGAAGLTAEPI
jgi:hypothetical protein